MAHPCVHTHTHTRWALRSNSQGSALPVLPFLTATTLGRHIEGHWLTSTTTPFMKRQCKGYKAAESVLSPRIAHPFPAQCGCPRTPTHNASIVLSQGKQSGHARPPNETGAIISRLPSCKYVTRHVLGTRFPRASVAIKAQGPMGYSCQGCEHREAEPSQGHSTIHGFFWPLRSRSGKMGTPFQR